MASTRTVPDIAVFRKALYPMMLNPLEMICRMTIDMMTPETLPAARRVHAPKHDNEYRQEQVRVSVAHAYRVRPAHDDDRRHARQETRDRVRRE